MKFEKSSRLLSRAKKVIPGGSQTFSKSDLIYPNQSAPLFASHASGGYVWDVDGNKYIDYVSSLLPVLLGYSDDDVDCAIKEQLKKGIIFSLSSELEIELAEILCEIIPCAEMVRFAKNGSDATSAAVRVARAFTGSDRVIACGYHGWQDWYIGSTTRYLGVPKPIRELTHKVKFGDLAQIEEIFNQYNGEVACVIMEPMSVKPPPEGYFTALKELVQKHNALLIFDEVITGFRFSLGGAQEYFHVKPDLAAFGKGMGNGMPISALVGRKDVMSCFEDVFFSGTFGGEALSLAAAIAVIKKLREKPVLETIHNNGQTLQLAVNKKLDELGLLDHVYLGGHPSWSIFEVQDHKNASAFEIKTFLLTRCLNQGLLIAGSHNISFAHSKEDIDHTLKAYDTVLHDLAEALDGDNFRSSLGCEPIKPVFRVRE